MDAQALRAKLKPARHQIKTRPHSGKSRKLPVVKDPTAHTAPAVTQAVPAEPVKSIVTGFVPVAGAVEIGGSPLSPAEVSEIRDLLSEWRRRRTGRQP